MSTATAAADEEWVKAAMSDDSLVVDLLVRLHRTPPPPPPATFLIPNWTVRQRRSKPPSHRASPTTPLSAATLSGGSGEDSSRPPQRFKLSDSSRSKVNGDSEKTASKRPRKKTLPELKEEEKLLVKERRELKRVLAALRTNLDNQRGTNEKLKKMKLELLPNADKASTSTPDESVSGQFQESTTTACASYTTQQIPLSNDITEQPSIASDHKFALPDLNMPFDEPISDVTCEVS